MSPSKMFLIKLTVTLLVAKISFLYSSYLDIENINEITIKVMIGIICLGILLLAYYSFGLMHDCYIVNTTIMTEYLILMSAQGANLALALQFNLSYFFIMLILIATTIVIVEFILTYFLNKNML